MRTPSQYTDESQQMLSVPANDCNRLVPRFYLWTAARSLQRPDVAQASIYKHGSSQDVTSFRRGHRHDAANSLLISPNEFEFKRQHDLLWDANRGRTSTLMLPHPERERSTDGNRMRDPGKANLPFTGGGPIIAAT